MSEKPRKPLRRTGMKPGTTPIARSARIRPKPRTAGEFARIYGSKARVAWVKAQPCAVTGFGIACTHEIENAHTVTGGTGRKADADTIVPLCHAHHAAFDQHRFPFNVDWMRQQMKDYAARVEAKWQAHQSESA